MKKFLSFLFVLFLLLGQGCRKKDESTQDSFATFNRKGMLSNISGNVIIPSFDDAFSQTALLEQVCSVFVSSPSEATLLSAQQQWRLTAESWKRCEFYQMNILESAQGVLASIDYASANFGTIENAVNKTLVENTISTGSGITSGFIETQPPTAKGLATIEYLLFNRANGNSYILNAFTGNQNRKDYLTGTVLNLKGKIKTVADSWKSAGGNYASSFNNADGRDIGSAIGLLVNNMVFMIEGIKNEKIGRPLGKRTNGSIQPQAAEAAESLNSFKHIKNNLTGLENAFKGKDGQGLDDLLTHLGAMHNGESLSTKIIQQFATIHQKIDAVTIPLQDAVTQNPAAVEEIYIELKKLVVLTKVDMVSNIGVIITYQDNDGD